MKKVMSTEESRIGVAGTCPSRLAARADGEESLKVRHGFRQAPSFRRQAKPSVYALGEALAHEKRQARPITLLFDVSREDALVVVGPLGSLKKVAEDSQRDGLVHGAEDKQKREREKRIGREQRPEEYDRPHDEGADDRHDTDDNRCSDHDAARTDGASDPEHDDRACEIEQKAESAEE